MARKFYFMFRFSFQSKTKNNEFVELESG